MAYKSRWFVTRKVDKVSGCYKYFPQKHVFQKQKLPQFMEESNRKSCKNFQTYSYCFLFYNCNTEYIYRCKKIDPSWLQSMNSMSYVMTIDYQTDQLAIWHNTIRVTTEFRRSRSMSLYLIPLEKVAPQSEFVKQIFINKTESDVKRALMSIWCIAGYSFSFA